MSSDTEPSCCTELLQQEDQGHHDALYTSQYALSILLQESMLLRMQCYSLSARVHVRKLCPNLSGPRQLRRESDTEPFYLTS